MEIFTTESSHLRSCIEFSTVIRFIKAVFYRPDHQKLLMCSLIKRVDEAFVSKDTRPSFWEFKRKVKARPRVWNARSSVWKARPHAFVITRPMLSQSATVSDTVEEREYYMLFLEYCHRILPVICLGLYAILLWFTVPFYQFLFFVKAFRFWNF